MNDILNEIQSFQQQIMGDLQKKVLHEWNLKLKEYVTKNLSDIGYIFSSDEELVHFIKEKVKQYTFDRDPNYHELYIEDKEARLFIGSYSDKMHMTMNENNTVTATIG